MAEETFDEPVRHEERESPIWAIVLLSALVVLIIAGLIVSHHIPAFNEDETPAIYQQWIKVLGFITTLGIFSVLYKENPVFRFLEHIFIGLAAGYGLVVAWFEAIKPMWYTPLMPPTVIHATADQAGGGGQWWMVFGLLIGLLFYTVYFPKLAWMNRFALIILMGMVAGAALQAFISLLGPQIVASFKAPITTYYVAGLPALNNIAVGSVWVHPFAIVFLVVLVCALSYFFFSLEHNAGWVRVPANTGRYFLMITLGAIFGTTVMGRFSLLIARLQFLIDTLQGWWHLVVR